VLVLVLLGSTQSLQYKTAAATAASVADAGTVSKQRPFRHSVTIERLLCDSHGLADWLASTTTST
jgi:hypothetical protein